VPKYKGKTGGVKNQEKKNILLGGKNGYYSKKNKSLLKLEIRKIKKGLRSKKKNKGEGEYDTGAFVKKERRAYKGGVIYSKRQKKTTWGELRKFQTGPTEE